MLLQIMRYLHKKMKKCANNEIIVHENKLSNITTSFFQIYKSYNDLKLVVVEIEIEEQPNFRVLEFFSDKIW